ncbi:GIY-YIG nuclease family protein [Patescibacteria group bacterium]|nr:GIY-YIG nuclease family protein [Patescibacteria group bacterium]
MPYYVYLFGGENNKLYIGQTNNIIRRLEEHKIGKGGKYSTKKYKGILMLRHLEMYETREEAETREKQLKGWTRKKKEALIRENEDQLKKFSKKIFNKNKRITE